MLFGKKSKVEREFEKEKEHQEFKEIVEAKYRDSENDNIGLTLFDNEYTTDPIVTELTDKTDDESMSKFKEKPVVEEKKENLEENSNIEDIVIYKAVKDAGINPKKVKIIRNIRANTITLKANDKDYYIDDGSVLGGKRYSILLDIDNNGTKDTAFVPIDLKYKDLIVKAFKGELLTLEEAVAVMQQNYLSNLSLYSVFDFTGTENINNFKDDEYKYTKFAIILGSICDDSLEKTANKKITEIPRMRFTELNDFNNFTVVSDEDVKCKMKESNNTYCKGIKYVVTPEKWEYYFNDEKYSTATFTYTENENGDIPMKSVTPENYNPFIKYDKQ